MSTATREVATPAGVARVHVDRPRHALATLVLGHGAGGGVEAVDLVAVRDALVEAGWAVARVEQPWRVAGRRLAPAPPRLDLAWVPVVQALRTGRAALPGPLVLGGRSAGARVACRTASVLGAVGLVALAFPLHPPGRPERSRADELVAAARAGRRVLVVQGERDAFGRPDELRAAAPPGCEVVGVRGDHALSADLPAVAGAVVRALRSWTE